MARRRRDEIGAIDRPFGEETADAKLRNNYYELLIRGGATRREALRKAKAWRTAKQRWPELVRNCGRYTR